MADSTDIDWVEWERWKGQHGRGDNARGEFWEKRLKDRLSLEEWRRRVEKHEAAMANDLLRASSSDEGETATAGDGTGSHHRHADGPIGLTAGAKIANRYNLIRELGRGGYGVVWCARDKTLGRDVALKFVRPDRSIGPGALQQEATKLATITHPHMVTVYDLIEHDGHACIVMQLIVGRSLKDRLCSDGPIAPIDAAKLIADVADAVQCAHVRGYIHRDIKPANILLDQEGAAYLADLGIAATRQQLFAGGSAVVGTSPYMSPEQIAGSAATIDGRTDVWSLGVVLYECLAARRPFHVDQTTSNWRDGLEQQIREMAPQPLRQLNPDIPEALHGICLKCLEKGPASRFETAGDLASALRRLVDALDRPPEFQPVGFSSLVQRKREGFVGREWLFDEMDSQAGTTQVFLVTGEPGSGKSSIIAELVPESLVPHDPPLDLQTEHAKAVKRIADRVIAFHFCEYGRDDDALNAFRFVASIAATLVKTLPAHATQFGVQKVEAAVKKNPVIAFKEAVLDPLRQVEVPKGESRYLLIDALDEAEVRQGTTGPSIVEVLARNINHMPPWLLIVATVRRGDAYAQRLGTVVKSIDLEVVEADNDARKAAKRSDLQRFIARRLGSAKHAELIAAEVRQTSKPREALVNQIATQLLEKAEGNFLYAAEALQQMEETRSLDVGALPKGLFGIYHGYLRRHYVPNSASWELARRALELVITAYMPPSEGLIRSALGVDEYRLGGILEPLRTYILERCGGLEPFHKALRDWLVDPINTDFHVSREAGHRAWAQAGLSEFNNDPARLPDYYARFLPRHLVATIGAASANERDAFRSSLVALLDDDRFIRRKRTAMGREAALLWDIGEVLNILPFPSRKWDEARKRLTCRTLRTLEDAQAPISNVPASLVRSFQHINPLLAVDVDSASDQCFADDGYWVLQYDIKQGRLAAKHNEFPSNSSHYGSRVLGEALAGLMKVPAHILSAFHELWMRIEGAVLNSTTQPPTLVRINPDPVVMRELWPDMRPRHLQPVAPNRWKGKLVLTPKAAISADGRTAVFALCNGHLRVYCRDSTEWKVSREIDAPIEVTSVSVEPTGGRIVFGGRCGRISIWSACLMRELRRFRAHRGPVLDVAVPTCGEIIVSGGDDGALRVWHTRAVGTV